MQPLHPAQETTPANFAFALIFLISSWVLAASNGYNVSPNVENLVSVRNRSLYELLMTSLSFVLLQAGQPSCAHKKFSNVYFKCVDLPQAADAVR